MTQLSTNMRVIQAHSLADGKLSPKEFKELKTQFKTDNPKSTEADFKTHMQALFRGEKDHTTAELNHLFQQAESGKVVSLDLGFDEALNFDIDIKGAKIKDADGLHRTSKGDISGNIDSIKGNVNFFGDKLNSALRAKVKSGATDFIQNLAAPDPNDTDSEWTAIRWVENLYEDSRDSIKESLSEAAQTKVKELIDASSFDISSGTSPSGDDAIALKFKTPYTDHTFNVYSGKDGGLVVDTPFEISKNEVDSWYDVSGHKSKIEKSIGQYGSTVALSAIQIELSALGIQTDIVPDNGTFIITPKDMTLTAEKFKELTGKELPEGYENGEITLTPEDIDLSIKNGKLNFEVKNIKVSGSSDARGGKSDRIPPGGHEPAILDLEKAHLETTLKSDGEMGDTVISDIKGTLEAESNLSPETLIAIKNEINQVMTRIDDQLKNYGLSREQLTSMVSQLPNDLLSSLLSSNNKTDILDAAKTLGIDSGQLQKAMSFLKEEPYRQLVSDINRMSAMIEENTQVKGKFDFQINELKLKTQDSDFLATMKGLDISGKVASTTPEGVKTEGDVKISAETASLTPDALDASEVKTSADLTIDHPAADNKSQLNAFRQALAQGGPNRFVKADGYIKDDEEPLIRKAAGLKAATARKVLSRVDNQTLLRLKGANDKEIELAAKQNDVKPHYLKYLVRYADRHVTTESEAKQAIIQAEATIDKAHLEKGDSSVKGLSAKGKLVTGDTTNAAAQIDAFKSDLNAGNHTPYIHSEGHYKGYLKEDDNNPIRKGKGLTPKTFSSVMNQVDTQTLVDLNTASDSEILDHAKSNNIEPPQYLRYVVRYANRYVSKPSFDSSVTAKISATALETDGKVATLHNPTLSARAHVASSDPDTVLSVDASAKRADASQTGVGMKDVTLEAQLNSDTDANLKGHFDTVSGTDERLSAKGGSIEEFEFENGKTQIKGSVSDINGRAENGKISAKAKIDWDINNTASGSKTHLQGSTDVDIRLNELFEARTKNMRGEIKVSTDEFLGIAKNAGMTDFVNSLQKDGTILNKDIFIKVDNKTSFDYNKSGTTKYSISARIPDIKTKYGRTDLAFSTNQSGEIKGRMYMKPNQHLANLINDSLREQSGVDVNGTSFEGGKIRTSVSHAVVSGIVLDTALDGDTVKVKINGAKLFGLFKANGMTRDKALKALERFKATASGKHEIHIPLKSLTSAVLDPQTAARTDIKATLDKNNILRLDFAIKD